MQQVLAGIEFSPGQAVGMITVAMVMAVPIVAIIAEAWKSASVSRDREQTRREIAAYVAEGTITPADAERILTATPSRREKGTKRVIGLTAA